LRGSGHRERLFRNIMNTHFGRWLQEFVHLLQAAGAGLAPFEKTLKDFC